MSKQGSEGDQDSQYLGMDKGCRGQEECRDTVLSPAPAGLRRLLCFLAQPWRQAALMVLTHTAEVGGDSRWQG